MQGFLGVHQGVGVADVDEAPVVSLHLIHQERQIMELILYKSAPAQLVTFNSHLRKKLMMVCIPGGL